MKTAEKRPRVRARQKISWLHEIEVPIEDTLTREQEIVLGHRVRTNLERLRQLLLRHPTGVARQLAQMTEVAAEKSWLFAWIPRKEVLEDDLAVAVEAFEEARTWAEDDPSLARRAFDRCCRVLQLYPLEPEMICREARRIHAGDTETTSLDTSLESARVAAALGRLLDRIEADKEKMVISNLRLVLKNALEYLPQGQSRSDLYQEGIVGLQRAIFRFNPEHGVRFATYATHWIRQGIRKAIKDSSRVIRVPVGVQEKLSKNDGSLSENETERVKKIMNQTVFIFANESEDGDHPVLNLLGQSKSAVRDEELHLRQIPDAVGSAVDSLSEREQFILRHRFGLGGAELRTLEECGVTLKLSRERVRQLERAALERLRTSQQLEELFQDLSVA